MSKTVKEAPSHKEKFGSQQRWNIISNLYLFYSLTRILFILFEIYTK